MEGGRRGGDLRWQRQLGDGGVTKVDRWRGAAAVAVTAASAAATTMSSWSGQGVAAVAARIHATAAAMLTAVGLFP